MPDDEEVSFLAAKKRWRLLRRDDETAAHDAHADPCLRREARLLQPQAAQPDPGQSRLGLRVKLHGQEPLVLD